MSATSHSNIERKSPWFYFLGGILVGFTIGIAAAGWMS